MDFTLVQDNVQNLVMDVDVINEIATPNFGSSDELRIVLIGKTGSGKSTTGNSLLGETKFVEDVSSQSVTTYCESYRTERFGKSFRVVDTPGLFDTSLSLDKVAKEISRCVVMLSPGPHAFLFVLRVGRFTEEEQNTVSHLLDIFGSGALSYIIIVFTYKDDLDRKKRTLQQYINGNQKLKELTDKCPVFPIDNTKDTDEQAKNLIALVEQTVQRNGNVHYTNEMLQRASEAFELKKKQLQEEEQRKFEEKIRPLREKFENEQTIMNQKLSELEVERMELQDKVESGHQEFQQLLIEKNKQMEEFRKDMDNANRAHEYRISEIEADKNNALKEIQLKLEYEKNVIAKLEETYANQMATLRTELERQRKQLQEESDAKLDKIMSEYRAENERERQRRDQEIAIMRQAHERELERLQEASDKRFEILDENMKQLQNDNKSLRNSVHKCKGNSCSVM